MNDNTYIVYKVEFNGFTCMLSLWEFLRSLPHEMSGGIWLDFRFLHQDFWAQHVISISNHREPLPHSLHTQNYHFTDPTYILNI